MFPICLHGQIDTEFWFVAPDVDADHGDTPIILSLASAGEAADVTFSLPADPSFEPIIYSLAANETRLVFLTQFKNQLENTPANTVLQRGILISATSPITTYYHPARSNNQDIYPLKGKQALGNTFFIPSQTTFENVHGNSFFDIVATQDQTTIEITPTKPVIGHGRGETFSITLNRGESFTVRARGQLAGSQLAGTKIVSDKPIAITNSDDSIVNEGGRGWDLVGDQIVPVKMLGTEYIAIKASGLSERLYITATENDTEIEIDGNTNTIRSIQEGETVQHRIRNRTAYVKTNKPVYVWHLSGYDQEPGGSLLPPIGCTGLLSTTFVRPPTSLFDLLILTEKGMESSFVLNDSIKISSSHFRPVPDKPDWLAAKITQNQISLADLNKLSNAKGLFHLGIIMDARTGSAYGYFSNYNNLALGESQTLCFGDTLRLNAGSDLDEYLWSTGSTEQSIQVTEGGTYWVEGFFQGCTLSDTIEVQEEIIEADLGEDQTICFGDTLSLDATEEIAQILWEDGSNIINRKILKEGIYSVRLNRNGCLASDTIQVHVIDVPPLSLGPDTLLCKNESITLNAKLPEASFLWQDGNKTGQFEVTSPGTYWVERSFQDCIQRDSIEVNLRETAFPIIQDTTICEGDSIMYSVSQSGNSYQWDNGSTSPERIITEENLYSIDIINRCGNQQQIWWVYTENCNCDPFIPNVFSPNGDGLHDTFKPVFNCDLTEFELMIFDRWGRKVFESSDATNTWNGKDQAEDKSEGVYYYQIRYKASSDEAESKRTRGNLTLLR